MDISTIGLIIIVAALILILRRPAPQQYIVVPVEPVQSRGWSCSSVLAVVFLLVVLALALTPGS